MQLIAYLSMFIDHIFKFAFKDFAYNPILGRLAMPIFAYLIAIGMKRTSNKPKYILRLFAFALISQIPSVLMVHGMPKGFLESGNLLQNINHFTQSFNIGFTFLIASLSIYYIEENRNNFINIFIIIIISLFIANELKVDYGYYGIITIYIFYYIKDKVAIVTSLFSIITIYILSKGWKANVEFALYFKESVKSYFAIAALPIIFWLKENKKRDNKFIRFFKYAIYPAHMLAIYLYYIFA